jgi:uncharacterized protein (TIGR03382 family)
MTKLLAIGALYPLLTGFVLLSSKKAALPATVAEPNVIFYWDATAPAPEIEKKDEYRGGAYREVDDLTLMRQLLVDAMDMWNSVPGAFVTLVLADADPTRVIQEDRDDKQNSIIVAESSNLSSAAYAQPQIDDSATIVDCDITVAKKKTTAKELAFTLTHELGHCLGLGHAHSNYNAIMGYSRTSRNFALGADDIAGLIYLYPDPKYGTGAPKELAACGTTGGKHGSAAAGGLLLLPLLGALAPRRRPARTARA